LWRRESTSKSFPDIGTFLGVRCPKISLANKSADRSPQDTFLNFGSSILSIKINTLRDFLLIRNCAQIVPVKVKFYQILPKIYKIAEKIYNIINMLKLSPF